QKRSAQLLVANGKVQRRQNETELLADIVPHAVEVVGVYAALRVQPADRVGQLDFPSRTDFLQFKEAEDVRRQHITSHNGEIGRRFPGRRLLDERVHAVQPPFLSVRVDNAVSARLAVRYRLNADDGAARLLVLLNQLLQAWRLRRDDVVPEQHRERLVPDEAARAPYGVAETLRLLLA